MVEGSVWGGATETVFACDLVVAAEGATFAATPARLGVPYNVGGMLTFLNAANLRIVKEMLFTAQPVDAARAERHGGGGWSGHRQVVPTGWCRSGPSLRWSSPVFG